MRKKFCSIITMLMILFACVLTSACGDKYKNMDFKVWYAYSADAEEWFDGSDGVSITYDPENIDNGEGDESSLLFDENGVGTLYVRIEVLNVKSKYVDSITVGFASLSGLNFYSQRVQQNQVFEVAITDNVDTTLKLYENNSNKKKEIPFVVSRELEKIEAIDGVMPAIKSTNWSQLNLATLGNLKYYPLNKTNQLGAVYSIEGIGCYDGGTYTAVKNADAAQEYAKIEGSVLTITDGSFFTEFSNAYIFRIKATSVFYADMADIDSNYYTYFDVYVVSGDIGQPIAKYKGVRDGYPVTDVNIYENGGTAYSTATIYIDDANIANDKYYYGLNTKNGVAKFNIAVYVENSRGVYERYQFGAAEYQSGINGLIVEDSTINGTLNGNEYRFSIVDRNVSINKVKFVYELKGINVDFANIVCQSCEFYVRKSVVPTCITINDALDLNSSSPTQYETVYGTNSATYKGLELKLSVNPNENLDQLISFSNPNLLITDEKGLPISSVTTGKTIYIKFKHGITENQDLIFKTLKLPTVYNGGEISVDLTDDANFIIVKYNLTKIVTADELEFLSSATGNETNKLFIDADNDSNIYVKVYYDGYSLDASSVKITSLNDQILFANNSSSIDLNDSKVTFVGGDYDANGRKYSIYSVATKAPQGLYQSRFVMTAGEGRVGVEKAVDVQSVYLMDAAAVSNIEVSSVSNFVKQFSGVDNSSFNFAVSRNERAELVVKDGLGAAKTISKIKIKTVDVGNADFSTSAILYNVTSNSTFEVVGKISGKTQVLDLEIYYYAVDDYSIQETSIFKSVQVAVYNGVGNITSSVTNSMIGFVNPYYKETSETTIQFNSYTETYGTPDSQARFAKFDGHGVYEETLYEEHASQIEISIANEEDIKNSAAVEILYVLGGYTINLLDPAGFLLNENNKVVLKNAAEEDLLNGKIKVSLVGDTGLNEISITISALRFGVRSNIVKNIVIKIADVDKAERIVVSGKDFIQTGDVTNEIRLSFIDVADGGYDEAEFNAGLQFGGPAQIGTLRFDDIKTAMTHILYEYTTDAEGNTVVTRIANDFLTITYLDGKINIKAEKRLGGGVFKLVLVTKDSYNLTDDPDRIVLKEEHFNKTYPIVVRVSDGEIGSEYIIEKPEEMALINYNLNSNFVLGANLDLTSTPFNTIGLVGSGLRPFEGSLNGSLVTYGEQDARLVFNYSLTFGISTSAESTEYGLIYGLFGIIGEHGKLVNLKVNAVYDKEDIKNSNIDKGTVIGSLAGVNKGSIENVSISILANAEQQIFLNNIITDEGEVFFGGIVGINEAQITKSRVECAENIYISADQVKTYNIGLIAGKNNGTISGSYLGKDSLNDYVYDVIANLTVYHNSSSNVADYRVGSVAGANTGVISNLLVGGKIDVGSFAMAGTGETKQQGCVGGIVGKSDAGEISTVTALSLNLTTHANAVDVAGIVGLATGTNIINVKYISVITDFRSFIALGEISGKNNVAGIVAQANLGYIKYATVESFVEKKDGNTFNTLTGKNVAGLAVVYTNANASSVTQSFVKANISATSSVALTSEITETDTYFIGKVSGAGASDLTNTTKYSIVNGEVKKELENKPFNIADYVDVITVDENTTDWTNIYTTDETDYFEAKEYVLGNTYYKLDVVAWTTFVTALVPNNGNWEIKEGYNVVKFNGVSLFFPYLLREFEVDGNPTQEPLMIVAPQSITASLDQEYITDISSIYIAEFVLEDYLGKISKAVVVNYYNGAGDEGNAYKLIGTKDGIVDLDNGLLDVEILPEDAQGLYMYEIIGTGRNYAYINSKKEIVFTGVSGSTPIIVRIYSGFNPEVEVYVAIYTQSLLTEFKLNAGSIYYSNNENFDYEINAYSGQSHIIISVDAENKLNGSSYTNILEVYNLSQYLSVSAESDAATSKLEVDANVYNNITLGIEDGAVIEANYSEVITFKLMLDKEYFNIQTNNAVVCPINENVSLAEVKLNVHLYNSAKSIQVIGEDEEKTTHDDISFDVYLTTDFVEAGDEIVVEELLVDEFGNIRFNTPDTHDSIIISLDVVGGETEKNKLLENNGLTHFAELFLEESSVVRRFMKTAAPGETIGYIYNVRLELKDEHTYRYIQENIKFNIFVTATSNPSVNTKENCIEITMKPTQLSTLRIENYAVKTLNVNTDYTDLVTNDKIETSVVEPGSLGNVMLIYLEPTYSNVVDGTVTIKAEPLYVPSLGRHVQIRFTQLVHEKDLGGGKGHFTTLYGEDTTTQVGNTLNLKLISEIDSNRNKTYTGVICVYIQLERFVGVDEKIEIELSAQTKSGDEITTVERSRLLLVTYLPGAELKYDSEKKISDGYLIQKGTYNNRIDVKIFGYQFNNNPSVSFEWVLPEGSEYSYEDEETKKVICKDIDGDGTISDDERFLIGDYISYILNKNYNEVVYNPEDRSYTLALYLNVRENIMASFKVVVTLELITQDGQIKTVTDELNSLIFYPTEYILNSVSVNGLVNGRKNIAINSIGDIDLIFSTDNDSNDLSDAIMQELLNYATDASGRIDKSIIASKFSYYKNGVITFANDNLHPEFEFNLVNGSKLTILGISSFRYNVTFKIYYGYIPNGNGTYKVAFGEYGDSDMTSSLNHSFILNIDSLGEDNEIPIYGVDDIYNSTTGTWKLVEGQNYILMNDIELENVVPITTKIAKFDGNNRVISIKSFAVNSATENYGLFGTIGTYTTQDFETEQQITKQTILRNLIVDYSKFNGTLAINNSTASTISVGGLVGFNDGGLIYNCDVINLNAASTGQFGLIVASDANITFGGLVGANSGIITNSRVGRDAYTRIEATLTTESAFVKNLGPLTFEIYNSKEIDDKKNQFKSVVGGLVGNNSGIIATSYVANTNLFNYSTNEEINITSGFVGINSGNVEYSYISADESTKTTANPYSTGFKIENKGNGIVAGFVYNNSGTITNSYVNTELQTKSAYIAGFVYENTGKISESYAAATMNSGDTDNNAEQPFVGVDNAGKLLSFGTLKNTYYLMRSDADNPYYEGDKDVAQALNLTNFQDEESLIGFSFVLSNIKYEREQGIWSYYSIGNRKRLLPELINADKIAHSYRFILENEQKEQILISATSYVAGSENNPYTISSVEDYNKVFVDNNEANAQTGYIRFINNIDFGNEGKAIKTRSNYTLGSDVESTRTSVEGNGMTISGIYIDVDDITVTSVGMFAEIKNTYIKNLNFKFATPTTNGQFSTTTAKYSGGLAGKIENSVVLNISLEGNDTTLTGSNFVGGLAGHISGKSLVYGIETNLNVKAGATEGYLYYNEKEYNALNRGPITGYSYQQYLSKLSYAGGLAGVLDLQARNNVKYNVQYIDIYGHSMNTKTFEGVPEANILAEYAGGVAGYAGVETDSFKLKYHTGNGELIQGDTAVGGIYAVSLGKIVASQVTATENTQYNYDTEMGKYIDALETEKSLGLSKENRTALDLTKVGNTKLLKGYGYVGGLIGIGLNADIESCYSKVGIVAGKVVGGLYGVSVGSNITYSYSIPYINSYSDYQAVGGLIGSSYGIEAHPSTRNEAIDEYEALLRYYKITTKNTDIVYTFSTLIVDVKNFNTSASATLDYICADYTDTKTATHYLQSSGYSNLVSVYAGVIADSNIVSNNTGTTNKSSIAELYKLYRVGDPEQLILFNDIFTGWSIEPYWSLNNEKYFPLLINDVVDNFIDIDEESDLEYIRQNPDGNFRLICPITVSCATNWVIKVPFTGTLVGYMDNDVRPSITIESFAPNIDEDTCGFFKQTLNASISNIEIIYKEAIDLDENSSITSLKMVAGLTCDDTNSKISYVQVRAYSDNNVGTTSDCYIINDEDDRIGGFGGIVGTAKLTTVSDCTFVGQINANLYNNELLSIYFGGIVGQLQGATVENPEDPSEVGTAVINNCSVGASKEEEPDPIQENDRVYYPTTQFDLTIDPETATSVYIGNIVGNVYYGSIAGTKVGGAGYANSYTHVNLNVIVPKISDPMYIGGNVGFAEQGQISKNDVLTNMTINQKEGNYAGGDKAALNIGGLAGYYNLGAVATLATGIHVSTVDAHIVVGDGDDETPDEFTFADLRISTGVAEIGGTPVIKQCLFNGEIQTELAEINSLRAGGAVGYIQASSSNVTISEVITNSEIYAQSSGLLYAGGIIGCSEAKATISYSASWGRVVPVSSGDAVDVYAGGIVAYVASSNKITINNSYTISSIVSDSITGSAITKSHLGAISGSVGVIKDTDTFFYSTDYALCTDQNGVGKNYSAVTMIRDSSWHTKLKTENGAVNNIWTSEIRVSRYMLPFLMSLELKLKEYGLITSNREDYVEGSPMNPKTINAGGSVTFDTNNYNYYIVTTNGENKTFTVSNGYLNGVLIGTDDKLTFELSSQLNSVGPDGGEVDATYYGIIPAVYKHSAISNLHVEIESGEHSDLDGVAGIIAGFNNGIIFNCSVLGNGIQFTGSSTMGLIAGKSNGLISSSYSSAEIINATVTVAGIVHTNGGRLIHNYFTGYINGTGHGIFSTEDPGVAGKYVYNNYMGGVITGSQGKKFAGGAITGSNNFIDSYSDVAYEDGDPALKAVSTATLMAGNGLEGYWYKTIAADKPGVINTNSDSFGRNFNYPVHQFNKIKNSAGTDKNIDLDNVVDTGNGVANLPSLADRYNAVQSDGEAYANAIKISHFGILTSVHSLISQSRDYVLIYDLDGEKNEDSYKEMTAIGSAGTVNDFKNQKEDGTENDKGFQGVFVTNRYLGYNAISETENICTIANFSEEGMFTGIYDAYFGNIIFGKFKDMQESGPLGKSVEGSVTVNGISYMEDTEIKAKDASDNYYSALVGSVNKDGASLEISNYKSNNVSLVGNNKTIVGLIAGTSKGTITFDESDESEFIASFKVANIAGGVVGKMTGGTIFGKNTIINIKHMEGIEILGGVVGETNQDTSTIDAIGVAFNSGDAEPATHVLTISANIFGGIIGRISNSEINLTGATLIQIKNKQVTFNVTGGDSNFYGLLAGDQEGVEANISAQTFEIQTDGIGYLHLNVVADEAFKSYSETSTTCGTGVFVGKQGANITVENYDNNDLIVMITADGVPNIGSIAGLYSGGAINVGGIVPEVGAASVTDTRKFVVVGTTNVGGLYGYFNGQLEVAFGAKKSLLSSSTAFATVIATGSSSKEYKYQNVGGLFGKWETAEAAAGASSVVPASEPEPDISQIINSNNILIGYPNATYDMTVEHDMLVPHATWVSGVEEGYVYNVGGVAGSFTGTTSISLTNIGTIQSWTPVANTTDVIKKTDDETNNTVKAQNVGGVFGFMSVGSEISNAANESDVFGYQNVGGIVGYAQGGDGSKIVLTEELEIDYTDGTIAREKNVTGGSVTGVVNVGGVAGYAGARVEISNIYSTANVTGNVNVGGLVGISEDAILTGNYISTSTGASTVTIKGVYYKISNTISYLPTSVGGLAGVAFVAGENAVPQAKIQDNVINGITVISSDEAEDGANIVISRVSNYIATYDPTNAQSADKFNQEKSHYSYATAVGSYETTDFGAITTGFGGMFGSISGSALTCTDASIDRGVAGAGAGVASVDPTDPIGKNILKNVDINAPLGINTGAYYGVYKPDVPISILGQNVFLVAPKTLGTINNVDGAYNIGGVVGYIVGEGTFENYYFNTADFEGGGTISVQSRLSGMYVGGLIGRTTSNRIGNKDANQPLAISSGITIAMSVDKSYYVGGLIGKAEVDGDDDVNFYLTNTATGNVTGDTAKNFGGLIGLLKSGAKSGRLSITVEGSHSYPFTINTIENENYLNGLSQYSSKINSNNGIDLYAQAYYINLDTFNISVSQDVPDNNPLYSYNTGWHKDYTMVKTIQRCIPQDGLWDSVAVIYDAERIKGVVSDGDLIICTVYEEESGQPKAYTSGYIASILTDANGDYLTTTNYPTGEQQSAGLKYSSNKYRLDGATADKFDVRMKNKTWAAIVQADGFEPKEANVVQHSYNGVSYVFLKQKIFTSGECSTSGSLFEVDAYSTAEARNDANTPVTYEQPKIPWWQWLIVGVLAAASVVGAFFTMGQSLWGLKILFIVCVGGIAASAYLLGAMFSALGQKNENNAEVQTKYFETISQSEGFLSSAYAKKIKYDSGKIVPDTDDFDIFEDYVYQPLSPDKPSDYSKKRYQLLQATTDSCPEGVIRIADGAATNNFTGSIAAYTKTTMLLAVKEDAAYRSSGQSVDVITIGTESYVVVEYYIFKEGQYWINTSAASVLQTPSSDFYEYSALAVAHREGLTSYASLANNGMFYVHGSATRDETTGFITYSFDNNYGNYVTECDTTTATVVYDSQTYTINSGGEYDIPTKVSQKFRFKYYGAYTPDTNDVPYYNYIVGAYYTPSETSVWNGTDEICKYATYSASTQAETEGKGYTVNKDYLKRTVYNADGIITDTYYYVLTSVSDSGSVADFSEANPANPITMKIYPTSFTNPYHTDIITVVGAGNLKDNATYTNAGSGYVSGAIDYNVEYFLYISGFEASYDETERCFDVYVPVSNDTAIMLYRDDTAKSMRVIDALTADDDGDGVNDYDAYTVLGDVAWSEYKLNYRYENDQLYQINGMFGIATDEDYKGHFVRNDLEYASVTNRDIYNRGKYASDLDINLYTRYYYGDDNPLNRNTEFKEITGYTIAEGSREPNYGETYRIWKNQIQNMYPNDRTTSLVEVVKVTLGGERQVYPSGQIKIGEHVTGGKSSGAFKALSD